MRKPCLGIILAAGKSSRLFPATLATTKQLLSIYDKPLIYYPLSTLMMAGIKDVVIISNPDERYLFESLMHKTGNIDVQFNYLIQEKPIGLPDAFNIVGEEKINEYERICLVLGDNIHFGANLIHQLQKIVTNSKKENAVLFAHKVSDPERFGVIEIDENKKPTRIEEKPKNPKSNLAVTGLYFYPNDVYEKTQSLSISSRNELEITDLNNIYLRENRLDVATLQRGACWFDTGTANSLLEAANYIATIQKNNNVLVCSPHEIAFVNGWIDLQTLKSHANFFGDKTEYGQKLMEIYRSYV